MPWRSTNVMPTWLWPSWRWITRRHHVCSSNATAGFPRTALAVDLGMRGLLGRVESYAMSDDLTPAAADWPIVALVASAGGIDALSRVLSALPDDLPASIIALLHSS